ncbi:DUF4339 domain-containing protein [Microvirga subterranea]|uniref:Uncharacterized protein DUF4339 n=1 Tax=Microvirga subterranea TaxID=186651 RepID=A0A370H5Z6_9HYPH|nr:DUF4339 domain-containing protein [Microvirga subterranea]RDI51232.1 uncharacterized protein DUF4339 [Microvirga subterranea]
MSSTSDNPVSNITGSPEGTGNTRLTKFPVVNLKELADLHWANPDILRQIEAALAPKSTPAAVRLQIRIQDRLSELESQSAHGAVAEISQEEPPAVLVKLEGQGSHEASKTLEQVHTDRFWYVQHEGQNKGPYEFTKLVHLISAHKIAPTTLVWRAGWLEWKKASDVQGLFSPPDLSASHANKSAHLENQGRSDALGAIQNRHNNEIAISHEPESAFTKYFIGSNWLYGLILLVIFGVFVASHNPVVGTVIVGGAATGVVTQLLVLTWRKTAGKPLHRVLAVLGVLIIAAISQMVLSEMSRHLSSAVLRNTGIRVQ